jgi:hypothetical protein
MAANPFYVDPMADYSQGLAGLTQSVKQVGQQKRADEVKAKSEARFNSAKTAFQEAAKSGNAEKIADVTLEYPELSKAFLVSQGIRDKGKADEASSFMKTMLTASEEDRPTLYKERIQSVKARGGNVEQSAESYMRYASNPQAEIKNMELVLASTDPESYKALVEQRRAASGESGIEIKVGAQEILEDGTIIQSTNKGPVVYGPTGKKVTGKDAAETIKTAQAAKVSNIRSAAGEKKRATLEAEGDLKGKVEAGVITQKEAAKASVSAYKKLEGVNKNIANIDEAIKLLDEGASTGAVQSLMPSVRAASVKLDNLRNRLGIDVIGSVTFGALSQGELDLALAVALPPKLSPPELRIWLNGKRNAQEKLADYLESAAIHLGTPGNTHSTWLQYQKEQGGTPGVSVESSGSSIDDLVNKYAN